MPEQTPESADSQADVRIAVAPVDRPERSARKSIRRRYVEAFVLALLLALFVRGFVLQAFKIPSTSMLPTLLVGDHVLISKLHYGVRLPWIGGWLAVYNRPDVGEVVVFVPPIDRRRSLGEQRTYVKRVVAVGGEMVEIREGRLFVDGRLRKPPHARVASLRLRFEGPTPGDNFGPVRVPPGHLFVLGDNRGYSEDSRDWGPIEMQDVIGRALFIYWSGDERSGRVRWDRVTAPVR